MAHPQANTAGQPAKLLLLPPPPPETTLAAFRAAYEPPLSQVMTDVASSESPRVPLIYIAILLEQPAVIYERGRGRNYGACQGVFAKVYRLIAFLMAEKATDYGAEEQGDFRIVLVGFDGKGVDEESLSEDVPQLEGPFLDVQTLARSSRGWEHVFAVESEAGELFLRHFCNLYEKLQLFLPQPLYKSFQVSRVAGGTAMELSEGEGQLPQDTASKRHFSVAVGGTFDHLHIGHKLLLSSTAFLVEPSTPDSDWERCLTVGITGDELLKNKKYAQALESWDERQAVVYDFLSSIIDFERSSQVRVQNVFNEAEGGREVQYRLQSGLVIKCVEISNPFGPTITDEAISALVVSGETRSGGKAVNDRRAELGWAALEIFEVDVLHASAGEESAAAGTETFQSKISSTEIRKRMQQKSAAAL